MDFQKLIRQRYSVRAYRPDPVPDDVLEQVLEAARLAPTAANLQPFRVVVIHTAGREEELRRVYRREWYTQAPLVVFMCAVTSESWVRKYDGAPYWAVDAAIAMDHLILAATEVGLGACWIAAFDPAAAREVLGLPEGVEPVLTTPLGYPADTPHAKERRPLEELVKYERW